MTTGKIREIDEEQQRLWEELKEFEEEQGNREKYRKVVQASIGEWLKALKDGKIEMNSVSDLEKLLELESRLQRGEL